MVGDVLAEVDGKSVYRSPLSHISKYLLGPENTTAKVTFIRAGKLVEVSIVRAPVASLLCVRRISDAAKAAGTDQPATPLQPRTNQQSVM